MYELKESRTNGKYCIDLYRNGRYYGQAAIFTKIGLQSYMCDLWAREIGHQQIIYRNPEEGIKDIMPVLKEYYHE